MKNISLVALLGIFILSSCAVVRPGEVGIKQTLGKFSKEVKTQGTIIYNPLVSRVIK
ncbi:MAG: prohibitin 1, partial [Maribacter sp.]